MSLLPKKRCGLEIGDTGVSLLKLSGKREAATVEAFFEIAIPEGIVKDGQIIKFEELKKILLELFKKTKPKPIQIDEVVFSISEAKSFFGTFSLIGPEKKIEADLIKKASRRFPFKLEEVYSDYKIHKIEREKWLALYVAVEKKILDDYLKLFAAVEIEPAAIEFQSQSIKRALFGDLDHESCYLTVDINKTKTIICFVDHFGIRFSDVIHFGENDFISLAVKKLKIDEKEATELIKKHGMALAKSKKTKSRVLSEIADYVIMELKKVIEYANKLTPHQIKATVLSGEISAVPYLASYVEDQIGSKVVVSNHLAKIKKGKNLFKGKTVSSTLVGVSLKALDKNFDQEINLITE